MYSGSARLFAAVISKTKNCSQMSAHDQMDRDKMMIVPTFILSVIVLVLLDVSCSEVDGEVDIE